MKQTFEQWKQEQLANFGVNQKAAWLAFDNDISLEQAIQETKDTQLVERLIGVIPTDEQFQHVYEATKMAKVYSITDYEK